VTRSFAKAHNFHGAAKRTTGNLVFLENHSRLLIWIRLRAITVTVAEFRGASSGAQTSPRTSRISIIKGHVTMHLF
jgi:hypothetical protein